MSSGENKEGGGSNDEGVVKAAEEGDSGGQNALGDEKKESAEENQEFGAKDEHKQGEAEGGDAAESSAAQGSDAVLASGTSAAAGHSRALALIGIASAIARLSIFIIALVILQGGKEVTTTTNASVDAGSASTVLFLEPDFHGDGPRYRQLSLVRSRSALTPPMPVGRFSTTKMWRPLLPPGLAAWSVRQ